MIIADTGRIHNDGGAINRTYGEYAALFSASKWIRLSHGPQKKRVRSQ